MNQTSTKSDIVWSVHKANRFSISAGKAKETVEILIEIVKRTLSTGEDALILPAIGVIASKIFHLTTTFRPHTRRYT